MAIVLGAAVAGCDLLEETLAPGEARENNEFAGAGAFLGGWSAENFHGGGTASIEITNSVWAIQLQGGNQAGLPSGGRFYRIGEKSAMFYCGQVNIGWAVIINQNLMQLVWNQNSQMMGTTIFAKTGRHPPETPELNAGEFEGDNWNSANFRGGMALMEITNSAWIMRVAGGFFDGTAAAGAFRRIGHDSARFYEGASVVGWGSMLNDEVMQVVFAHNARTPGLFVFRNTAVTPTSPFEGDDWTGNFMGGQANVAIANNGWSMIVENMQIAGVPAGVVPQAVSMTGTFVMENDTQARLYRFGEHIGDGTLVSFTELLLKLNYNAVITIPTAAGEQSISLEGQVITLTRPPRN